MLGLLTSGWDNWKDCSPLAVKDYSCTTILTMRCTWQTPQQNASAPTAVSTTNFGRTTARFLRRTWWKTNVQEPDHDRARGGRADPNHSPAGVGPRRSSRQPRGPAAASG